MEIRETFVNQTENVQFGNSDWYEPFTQDRGKLFRDLQQEYGRCTGKMYRDRVDGGTVSVGWVFEKRMRYGDARQDECTGKYKESAYYMREVWVELREEAEFAVVWTTSTGDVLVDDEVTRAEALSLTRDFCENNPGMPGQSLTITRNSL